MHDSLQAAQDARAARAASGTISRAHVLAAQAEAHDRQADASLAEGDALGALGGGWTD